MLRASVFLSVFSDEIFKICRVSDRIYAFNPKIRRSNFYGQQLRALALVEAFHARKWLGLTERNYVVVGAGVTGMTVAAALLTVGASVTLIDRARPLQEYLNAAHRELHPNIISWPFQEMRAITDLPFLNWHCAPANDVAHQLLREWNSRFAEKVQFVTDEVVSVTEEGSSVFVECSSGERFEKDRAVLATGFDVEHSLGDNRTPGYWNPMPISKTTEVTVSGAGDGALIDAVYQLYGIEAVAAARVMATSLRGHSVVDDIRQVEQEALAMREAGDRAGSEARLASFYSKVGIPSDVAKHVTALQVSGIPFGSRIVHRGDGAFDAYAAPANKMLLALSMRNGVRRVRDAKGETVQDAADRNFYYVGVGIKEQINTADLVVRHGASHNLGKILTKAQMDVLDGHISAEFSAIVPDTFNREIFERSPAKPIAVTRWHGAQGQFDIELENRLLSLVKYVDKSARDVTIKRVRSDAVSDPNEEVVWEVQANIDASSALPTVFPVNVSGVTVNLSTNRPALPQY